MFRILVINPGSTSTKLAVYHDDTCMMKESVRHSIPAEQSRNMRAQLPVRAESVQRFLEEKELQIRDFDMIACRCGFLPYSEGRNYRVNELLVDVLNYAPTGQHASNLGAMIAARLAEGTDVPIVAPDGPYTDEMLPEAKVTGIPELEFLPGGHVLNAKQVCREVCRRRGLRPEEAAFVVAHMGGGTSVSAIQGGRIIDMNCTDKGPMSAERSGTLPLADFVRLCYSGKYTQAEMERHVFNRGGLCAHTGTNSARELVHRGQDGDRAVDALFEAMAYQVAKCVGEMYVALGCRADAVILTGSLAHSDYIMEKIIRRVEKLAPVERIPGELEMEALAGAALRVLRGQEEPSEYTLLPAGFDSREAFYAFVAEEKAKG